MTHIHPIDKLISALDELLEAALRLGTTEIKLVQSYKLHRDIAATKKALDDARVRFSQSVGPAFDAIPGIDEFVRPMLGTRPGQWTTELRSNIASLKSVIAVSRDLIPREGFSAIQYQTIHSHLLSKRRLLRDFDRSAFASPGDSDVGKPITNPAICKFLLYLHRKTEESIALVDLPEQFRGSDLLTVCERKRLIEFRRRNRIGVVGVGETEQRLEKGWETQVLTVNGRMPMAKILDEDLQETDPRFRLHIRLTAGGRGSASEAALEERAKQETPQIQIISPCKLTVSGISKYVGIGVSTFRSACDAAGVERAAAGGSKEFMPLEIARIGRTRMKSSRFSAHENARWNGLLKTLDQPTLEMPMKAVRKKK